MIKQNRDYELFLLEKEKNSDKVTICGSTDVLFEEAYNHVTNTGDKVRPCNCDKPSTINKSSEFTGFITYKEFFFMIDRVTAGFNSSNIFDLLRRLGLKDSDYINNQLKEKVQMLEFYE